MINKHSKGKEHTRRPLPVRAIAILMAIAMVLSVLYINNRRNKVEAETPTVSGITDDNYLKYICSGSDTNTQVLPSQISGKNIVVNVPAKGITFSTPTQNTSTTFDSNSTLKIKKASDNNYYKSDATLPTGVSFPDGTEELTATLAYEYMLLMSSKETISSTDPSSTEFAMPTSVTTGDSAIVFYLYKTNERYTLNSTVDAVPIVDVTLPYGELASGTVTVQTYDPSSFTFDTASSTVAVTDVNVTGDTSTFYYGNVSYTYSKDSGASTSASLAEINALFNNGVSSEGKYSITKTIKDRTNAKDIFTKTVSGVVNKGIFKSSFKAGLAGAEVSAPDGVDSVTVPATGYLVPGSKIGVDIQVDNYTSFVVKKGTTDVTNVATIISDKAQTATGLSFGITGASDDAGSVTYTVTLTDNNGTTDVTTDDLTKDYTVVINYYNGKPTVSDITVDNKGVQKDPSNNDIYYVTNSEAKAAVSATASIADPKATDATIASATINGVAATLSSGAITGEVSLARGNNTVSIIATSGYAIASDAASVNVLYDPDAPYIVNTSSSKLTVSSSSTPVATSFDESTLTYTAEVSAYYATTVSIPVSDAHDSDVTSGIASVTINGTPYTVTSGKVTYSSAAYADLTDSRLSGTDEELSVVVTDYAGNAKTYKVVLDFVDERASIFEAFNEAPIDATNNYFHWTNNNRTATVTYTVYTNVDLDTTNATNKPHIMLTSTATTTATRVELKNIGARATSDKAGYKYMYILTYDYPSASMSDYHLKLVVKNIHGHESEHETEVRSVDIDRPTISAPTNAAWVNALELSVSIPDGTYSSGVDYVEATGTDKTKYTEFDSNNKFNAVVQQSPDASGTAVSFTAYDKAGNVVNTPWTSTFFVDQTKPLTGLTISDVTVEDGAVDNSVVCIQKVPTIKYSPSDTPSGINSAKTKAEITDGTTTLTLNATETSLSDYFTITDDKVYTITVYVEDQAGNSNTTTKNIKVDNAPPVVSVVVDDPTAPTKGINPYYNKDVEVKLTIKDTNIDGTTVQVYDNEDPITISWDTSNPSEWVGYYTATTPGSHTIKLTAKDTSKNTPDPEFATNTFVIDAEAPVIKTFLDDEEYSGTDAYKLSSATSKMVVTDDYGRDEADERVTIKLVTPAGETKTEVKNGAGPFTFAEDGVYTLTYEAIDKAGNPASKVISFTVDGAKPVHNIYVTTGAAKTAKYCNEYSNKVGKFENEEYTYGKYFNTDVFLDVAYFDYNISSVTVYDNDIPVAVNWSTDGGYGRGTIAISSEGYHEIKMSSTDKSGNTVTDSGFSAVYFTIDKTEPVINPYLNGEVYTSMTAYTYSALGEAVVVDENMDEDDFHITAIRELPDGSTETTFYSGQYGIQYTQDGFYTIIYTATDKAGNSSTFSYGFTVDTDSPVHNMYVLSDNPPKFSSYKNNYNNPVGVFDSRPSQESYEYGQYYGSDVSVELNVFDYNLDWVYVTDNGAEITPNWTWDGAYGKAVVTLSSEGYHELKMWSKDLSGNETEDTEVGQKVRLYVDKTSPSITTYVNSSLYTEGSGVRYLNTNASVSVSVNDANKDSTDLVRTSKMTPPGGSSSSQTDNIGETTENYSTEADYEVTYVATDLAGNKSATRNVQFRVDKTPPQLSITGDGTSTAKSVAVSFGIKEAFYWDMTSAKYSIYKKAEGTAEALEKTVDFTPRSANDSQSYTITDDAEYRFEFSAEDKCGNKTEMKGTLIKDGTAPVIMLSGVSNYDKTDKNVTLNISVDEAFYSSNKVTLTGTRTDIDGKKTNIDFNQFVTNRTKISNLEQLFEEDGIYDITVTSTDKAGNTSSKSLHFTIDTTDPEIGDLSKYDGVKTNKFEWDIDLDDLVKDLTVCDISVYMDGSLYDGTSEISDGSHVLRVEAVDELGHKSFKEVTFVLDTKAPNIIISNVEDGDRLLESTDVTVTVEIDEDVLDTVSLNDKSVTVTDNKATLTINSKGKYRINATAHDEAGNTSSTEIEFSFGKQMNIKLIAIIAGAAILLLAILLVIIKRRRDNAY